MKSKILEPSEINYEQLFESIQEGIVLVDYKTGLILNVNKHLVDLLGYSKKEMLKKYLWDIGEFKNIVASKENFKTLQQRANVYFDDFPMETKRGIKIDVEFFTNSYQVRGVTIIQCIIRDITAKVANTKELAIQKKLLDDANTLAKIGGFYFDTKTFTQRWTKQVFDILEIDVKGGEPKVPQGLKFVAPEYEEMANLAVERAVKYGEPYDQEWQIVTTKGNRKWVHTKAVPEIVGGKSVSVSGSFQDTTKQKMLEEKNAWLASFPILNPNPIVEIERGKDITYVNPKAKELFLDLDIKKMNHPFVRGLENFFDRKIVLKTDLPLREIEANGHYYIQSFSKPKDDTLRIYSVDICERKKGEQKLIENRQIYQSLFENMINGLAYHEMVYDKTGKPINYRYLEINPGFEKCTGIVAKNSIGKLVTEVLPGTDKDPANWIDTYAKVASTQKPIHFESYSENLKKWFDISAYSPKKGYFATSIIDITDRKKAEEIVMQEQELNKTIMDSIPGTFYILDEKGKYWRWNAYQRDEIVGKPEDQVSKTSAAETIHPDDRKLVNLKIGSVLKTGKVEIVEGRVLLRGGPAYKWFLMTGRRLMVNGLPYLIGTGIDVTEQKANEEKLKELDRLKDDFLAITTHELKTPLIPIKSQSQMLLAGDYGEITPEQRSALEMILRNEENLNTLTAEVLDLVKMKSSKFVVVLKQGNLNNLVSETVKDLLDYARESQIDISFKQASKVPNIPMDKARIKQVINNLLINSIKFTPKNGKIKVEIMSKQGELVAQVIDTGIGISKENIEKLFTPFFQIDSGLSRKYRGTGLGLATSKGIIEAHGGKIWGESEGLGKGSVFGFSLPIKKHINYTKKE